MADLLKQDMTYLWAQTGDIIAPDNTKISDGWAVEAVPRQWWNWMQNRVDTNVAYMLQKGIPEWDAGTEYIINKSYVQYLNVVYKAIATNTNEAPAVSPLSWIKAFPASTAASEALSTVTPANDTFPYFTGATTASTTALSAFARTLLDDADATAMRTTLSAQAADATLTAIAAAATGTNILHYFSGTDVVSTTTLSAFGRTLIDDADASAARTTLGLGTIATQNANSVSISGGTITGITDLAIADGGTGASTAADARTNLGLGTIATQNANTVAITGGSITGITDLAIADGGTGASTASGARTNLGLGSSATLDASTTGTPDTVVQRDSSGVASSEGFVAGSIVKASDTAIRALSADGFIAGFEAYGSSQGTGYVFVGQASNSGGGMFYNGDGSPAFAAGEVIDTIGFYRKSAGVNTAVFSFPANSDTVTFNGAVVATGFTGGGSGLTGLNATQLTSGTVPGDRGVTAGSSTSSFVEYNGTTKTAGQFDGGATAPTNTTRLNYDGNFYATNFFGAGANITALNAANVSAGTLAVARGGTGTTTSTGTGSVVLSASPALTGTPTVPTAASTTNTTQAASTAFVQARAVTKDSATGAASLPTGTSAEQPVTPVAGMFRFNTTTGLFEGYNGSVWSSLGGDGGFNIATAQAASGTLVDFTGIPSWAKRISVVLSDVSTSGSSQMVIRLGAGGIVSTGYSATSFLGTVGNATSSSNLSTAFPITTSQVAASERSGIITLIKITGNTWVSSGTIISSDNGSYAFISTGNVTLGADLDTIRLTTANGTDTFDLGTVNITYEG